MIHQKLKNAQNKVEKLIDYLRDITDDLEDQAETDEDYEHIQFCEDAMDALKTAKTEIKGVLAC